jgi:tryptophanyl-tRNA synthetase
MKKSATLHSLDWDSKKAFVLGVREKISEKSQPLVFVGSNVSGKLHLGHVVLLTLSHALAKRFNSKVVVSLNEIESVFIHDDSIARIYKNQIQIANFFNQHGLTVHSRSKDSDLVLFATRLWKIWLSDKKKYQKLSSYYKSPPNSIDCLSIAMMAVAPFFVCRAEKAASVLLVYGEDQQNNLDMIYDLYQQAWFKKEVRRSFDVDLPELNYLIIKLLPDLKNNIKMSKTKSEGAVSLEDISANTKLTEPIVAYIERVVETLGPTEGSMKNPWLSYVSLLLF